MRGQRHVCTSAHGVRAPGRPLCSRAHGYSEASQVDLARDKQAANSLQLTLMAAEAPATRSRGLAASYPSRRAVRGYSYETMELERNRFNLPSHLRRIGLERCLEHIYSSLRRTLSERGPEAAERQRARFASGKIPPPADVMGRATFAHVTPLEYERLIKWQKSAPGCPTYTFASGTGSSMELGAKNSQCTCEFPYSFLPSNGPPILAATATQSPRPATRQTTTTGASRAATTLPPAAAPRAAPI